MTTDIKAMLHEGASLRMGTALFVCIPSIILLVAGLMSGAAAVYTLLNARTIPALVFVGMAVVWLVVGYRAAMWAVIGEYNIRLARATTGLMHLYAEDKKFPAVFDLLRAEQELHQYPSGLSDWRFPLGLINNNK